MSPEITERNAYREGREIRPGCQHNLGCRCSTPYHLRESTPAEQAIEERMRQPFGRALEGPRS